jgi:pimeloyl-ACP methyl ester carboxylesterase
MRMIFFPGMGVDGRLFDVQRADLGAIESPDWIEPLPDESLASYGRRMAEHVAPTEPFVLGGMSFGGMLAQEVARHCQPKALVLLSTCRTHSAIPAYGRLLERLARAVSNRLLSQSVRVSSKIVEMFHPGLSPDHGRLIAKMFRDSSPDFLRWAAGALLQWEAEALDLPVYQLHGENDSVIPLARVGEVNVIRGAGHLVSLTHADEVNEFIREALRDVGLDESAAGGR